MAETPAFPWAEPEWKTAMATALSEKRISLQVKGESLETVLDQMRGQLGYDVDVTGVPAELHLKNLSMDLASADPRKLLEMIARRMKAQVHLRPGKIEVLPEGIDPTWEGDEIYLAGLARARRILDAGGPKAAPVNKILPVEYKNETLGRILLQIWNRLAIPVEFDARVLPAQQVTRVSLRAETMTAAQVLDDVTAAAGLTWAAQERRILVTFDDRAREIRAERERAQRHATEEVELAVKDRPLAFVVEEIGKQVGVPVVVDRALWEPDHPRITLRADPGPLRRLLPRLAKAIPARFLIRGEAIYLIPPAAK